MQRQIEPRLMISDSDMRNMHRFITEETHFTALDKLLQYAIEEAASLHLGQCEQQLRIALAELRRFAD